MTHILSGAGRSTCFRCFDAIFLCKSYGKNVVIRKPIRVLNSQHEESVVPPLQKTYFAPRSELQISKNIEMPAVIRKPEENVIPYEKLQKNDGRFTKALEMIKNRKKREKSGKILLEGKRLINDAIEAGMQIRKLYFSREEDLMDIKLKSKEDVEVCKVLYQTMKIWSSLTTCPGVMAIFKRPSADDINVISHPAIPVTVLCDNIREPGNLGSIIRNAAAAGCENVFLIKGCVDPWEIKVLRSACGGHFRIPIVHNIEWDQVSNYLPNNSTILIADNKADIDEVSATADLINYDEPVETEDETKYITFNEHNQTVRIDETYSSQSELENYENIQLPCHLYSAIKYPERNVVLYIGGETHGINPRIIKLACEFGGKKIKVPLENEMDSLNSAFAMTIILYEIKRQLSKLYVIK